MISKMSDSTEKKVFRRGNAKANTIKLKENKVTIGNDARGKTRSRNGDTDIMVETPEFQLLVRLYVPSRLLIRNNMVSRKQLMKYLPTIVNESVPELNFQLHIFLSSIVTTYVSSWYLRKLNTDNFEFVQNVYELLCDVVKDFAHRVLVIVELVQFLAMVNELASVLDRHASDLEVSDGCPKYARDREGRSRYQVTPRENQAEAAQKYLKESHVFFDSDMIPAAPQLHDYDASVVIHQQTLDPGLVYLRVLARNILQATFSTESMSPGLPTSAIAMNLVTIILADLVLEKTVSKLSSPRFILQTIVAGLADLIESKMEVRTEPKAGTTSLFTLVSSCRNAVRKLHLNFSAVMVAFSQQKASDADAAASVFYSPVLSLLDTLSGFSRRKLVFASTLGLVRSALFSVISPARLESFAQTFVMAKVKQASMLQDAYLASVVRNLQRILFDQDSGTKREEKQAESISDVREKVYNLLQTKADAKMPMGLSLLWLEYKNESAQDMKAAIDATLSLFDSNSGDHSGPISEQSDMNKLLVVQMLDCVLQHLYPEITSTS